MRGFAGDLAVGTAFLSRLPGFLRGRLDEVQARVIIEDRLRNREARFLAMVKAGIYDHPSNPYFRILENAGCAFGDMEKLVRKDGLEGTLSYLLKKGVFLRVGEFKGREPFRRPGVEWELRPEHFRNPGSRFHIPVKSSGSRSLGTPVLIDLAYVAECAVNCYLMQLARKEGPWAKADWEVPGGGALFRLLKFSRFGDRPERWFSQLDPRDPGLHPRYRWSAKALRLGSLIAGAPLPKLEYVPLEEPRPIVDWMTETLGAGKTPCLFTFPSSAVRVSRAARDAGIGLEGALFLISGEPITQARAEFIRGSGATPIARYGTIECGPIGYACLDPQEPDDVHLQSDLHAVIQAGGLGNELGVPPEALFLTTLSPHAPFIFLNVSMGDMAVLDRRKCGCAMKAAGWPTHLSRIRSFEKLTGSGMTFLDADVIRILEETLPGAFGGTPTDYQLLEEEGPEGDPILKLLISPSLGALDEARVREAFLPASAAARAWRRSWA